MVPGRVLKTAFPFEALASDRGLGNRGIWVTLLFALAPLVEFSLSPGQKSLVLFLVVSTERRMDWRRLRRAAFLFFVAYIARSGEMGGECKMAANESSPTLIVANPGKAAAGAEGALP